MYQRVFAIFAFFILAFANTAFCFAEDFSFTAAPDWVVRNALPKIPAPDAAAGGEYNLLIDRQIRFSHDEHHYVYRRAVKITSRSGLESSGRITADFDPAKDAFSIHVVRVHRAGDVFDRIPEIKFQTARREQDLQQGVTDGVLTVFAEIPDLRVGDIVEYEMSWRSKNIFWPGNYFDEFQTEYSVPVGALHYRILSPRGTPLTIRNNATEVEFVLNQLGDEDERIWALTNVPRKLGEDHSPWSYFHWGHISLSTMSEWNDVAHWGAALYDVDQDLPVALRARIKALQVASVDLRELITWAIRYVQDDIRYVSDAVGLGAYVPRPPSRVIELGYGDCKDKAQLLVVLLRALGVEAHPALVNTTQGDRLASLAPAPTVFDHVVVAVEMDGDYIWIDPTYTLQGGLFPDISPPDYGFALPLREGASLVPMDQKSLEFPAYAVTQEFDFENTKTDGVLIDIETVRTDYSADYFRSQIDSLPVETLKNDWIEHHQNNYPGLIARAPPEIEDMRNINIITVKEQYALPAAAFEEIASEFPFYAEGVSVNTPVVSVEARQSPVALPHPVYATHNLVLHGFSEPLEGVPEKHIQDAPARMRILNVETGDKLEIAYEYQTLEGVASPMIVEKFQKQKQDFSEWTSINYNLDAQSLTASTLNSEETVEVIFGGIAVLALFGGAIGLALWTFRHDDRYNGARVLIPAPPLKWFILNICSCGYYGLLWLWRCWRQVKRAGGNISPLLRFIFSFFFVYALFKEIHSRYESQVPYIWGIIAAIAFFIWSIVGEVATNGNEVQIWAIIVLCTSWLPLTLLAFMVNKANETNDEAWRHHQTWQARTVIGLLFGVCFFGLIISGMKTLA
ncbi:MAG: DUF3857 domain-containing transglutaminase family protein [Pseudomonadota bacterium]